MASSPRAQARRESRSSKSGLRTSSNKSARVNVTSSTSCYVTGFHVALSEEGLRKVFKSCGCKNLKSIRIVRRQNRPYGFINFFNSSDAADGARRVNNTMLGDRTLIVRLQV